MLNNVVLVGKISKVLVENEKREKEVIIEVQRSYLNSDGIYEFDFFRCILWDAISENLIKYCNKGDVVAIKGRLESALTSNEELNINNLLIIAERLVFLKKTNIQENEFVLE